MDKKIATVCPIFFARSSLGVHRLFLRHYIYIFLPPASLFRFRKGINPSPPFCTLLAQSHKTQDVLYKSLCRAPEIWFFMWLFLWDSLSQLIYRLQSHKKLFQNLIIHLYQNKPCFFFAKDKRKLKNMNRAKRCFIFNKPCPTSPNTQTQPPAQQTLPPPPPNTHILNSKWIIFRIFCLLRSAAKNRPPTWWIGRTQLSKTKPFLLQGDNKI